MTTAIISPAKGNSLYWLGRYMERLYIDLHLLRKCFDMMIDSDPQEYGKYILKIGNMVDYPDASSLRKGLVNDLSNPASIASCIERANDNALIVRDEITSPTLGYVEMPLEAVRKATREDAEPSVELLQRLTDWMLAFWGSIEERVYDDRVKTLLRIGKLVEHIDMNIRFGYKFYRIREAAETLARCYRDEPMAFNAMAFKELVSMLEEEKYDPDDYSYVCKVLTILGNLVTL